MRWLTRNKPRRTATQTSSLPAQVTGVQGTWVDDNLSLTWEEPASGDSPILSYNVWVNDQLATTVTAPSAMLTSLSPGTYTVTVSAQSALGEGPRSEPLVRTKET